jgi:hypothetical protein
VRNLGAILLHYTVIHAAILQHLKPSDFLYTNRPPHCLGITLYFSEIYSFFQHLLICICISLCMCLGCDGTLDILFLSDRIKQCVTIDKIKDNSSIVPGDIREIKWTNGQWYPARIIKIGTF